MNILVTGGAGYIGSITAKQLAKQGFKVVIFDSLENGHAKAVQGFDLVKGKTQEYDLVCKTLKEKKIDAVVHFAAYIEMGESYYNPYKYFSNNVYGSLQLFKAMVDCKVLKLVFSSTAGVYGNPERIPIQEGDRKSPENPYGESKLMVEKILKWFDKSYKFNFVSFRYFNAAGATLDGSMGEDHKPESHLIPNIIKTALGENGEFKLFGNDYDTNDGSCVRDYIHVLDLAEAHILALKYLDHKKESKFFNVGTGQGYSNKEVLEMVKKIIKKDFNVQIGPRRSGDANTLVADSTKLQKELNWKPQYSDLKTIVETAYLWHNKHPHGYK